MKRFLLVAIMLLAVAVICLADQDEKVQAAPADTDSLIVLWPDGKANNYYWNALDRMKKTPVGDMQLLPLTFLYPDCAKEDIEVTAVDSFVKKISGSQTKSAYLDPKARRVLVVKENGRTFTVRDVVQVAFLPSKDAGSLVIQIDGKKTPLTKELLASVAEKDAIPFPRLLGLAGADKPKGKSVTLVAADGYKKEMALDQLLTGKLHFPGMDCEFPVLGTKHQVRDLVRIEIR